VPAPERPGDEELFGEEQVPTSPRERTLELSVTVLLGLAALVSAWCAYQSTRFGGEQTKAAAVATVLRIESARSETRAGQLETVDATAFAQWIGAVAADDDELAAFHRRQFRDEFRPAFDAWLAQSPLTNPDAPATPFTTDAYRLASQERARALAAEAEQRLLDGEEAGDVGDRYVLAVVLLAAAPFLLGIQTRIGDFSFRAGLVGVSAALVLGTLGWILTLPTQLGV
jgi:hypothetical protein